ncbi:unnamed protein product [Heligmosomoides polygyrus]|uniref:Uncharacterized protein n=1 Tax=Heligmosomoides polygyrus TaxID=6339 RepID=A0A183F566_HELPZ|nr:unnamed protein product [Heligmosomoides polygyrus]
MIDLNTEVLGKRPEGRFRQLWLNTLHMDSKEAGILVSHDQAFDRANWHGVTMPDERTPPRSGTNAEEEDMACTMTCNGSEMNK